MTEFENAAKVQRKQTMIEIGFISLLLLFFFQLLTAFIEATYAFGLLGTSFPIEAVSVAFLFASILWLILPKKRLKVTLILLVFLVLAARMSEVFLDTRWKMIVSGLGVGSFLLLFPLLLKLKGRSGGVRMGTSAGFGLLLAVIYSIFLRSLCGGNDISEFGSYRLVTLFLGAAGLLLFWLYWQSSAMSELLKRRTTQVVQGNGARKQGSVFLHTIGIISVWVLLYFVFLSPNVITRWTGFDLLPVMIVLLCSLALFAYFAAVKPGTLARISKSILVLWNGLFLLALVTAILAHQVSFPLAADGFPLSEPPVPWWGAVSLYASLLLSPVIIVNFMFYVRNLCLEAASLNRLGSMFTLGGLCLLLTIFMHIFTTVYDYIPISGPMFRDRFWLVHLIPGLGMLLPILLLPQTSWRGVDLEKNLKIAFATALALSALSIIGVFALQARPAQVTAKRSLRVLTYNIQQGYSEDGLKSFKTQLDLIRELDADIIGLQESDTARVAGGNADVVRYFADTLDLYTYYGPKTVTGTFGIALLSRYPIQNAETFFMYSEGEQTAAILAQIAVGGKDFNILVTHLGNGGPLIQQQQVLERLKGLDHVVAVGDYNFRPDSDQYALTTQTLADSWLLTEVPDKAGQDIDPMRRIDHIFISPGTNVLSSWYIVSPASDHPAMFTEIGW